MSTIAPGRARRCAAIATAPETVLVAMSSLSDGDVRKLEGRAGAAAGAGSVAPVDWPLSTALAASAQTGSETASPAMIRAIRREISESDIVRTSGSTTRFGTKKRASQREIKAQPGAAARTTVPATAGTTACIVQSDPKRPSIPASDDGKGMARATKARRRAMSTAMIPASDTTVFSASPTLCTHSGRARLSSDIRTLARALAAEIGCDHAAGAGVRIRTVEVRTEAARAIGRCAGTASDGGARPRSVEACSAALASGSSRSSR